MGDRYIFEKNCPECGKKVEIYDASSSLMYCGRCACGWVEPNNYYEVSDNEIVLCTKEHYCKKYKHTDWCQRHRDTIASYTRMERADEKREHKCNGCARCTCKRGGK